MPFIILLNQTKIDLKKAVLLAAANHTVILLVWLQFLLQRIKAAVNQS